MAGPAASLFNVENDRILIAVGAHFDDFLDLAGGGSFVPDFLPRARPIHGLAFFEREAQGFAIHPREHQGFAGMGIDRHGGEQAVFIKLGRKFETVFDLFFIKTRSKAGVRFVVHARKVEKNGNLASLRNGPKIPF